MRISDWSSDVCSSDLFALLKGGDALGEVSVFVAEGFVLRDQRDGRGRKHIAYFGHDTGDNCLDKRCISSGDSALNSNGAGHAAFLHWRTSSPTIARTVSSSGSGSSSSTGWSVASASIGIASRFASHARL